MTEIHGHGCAAAHSQRPTDSLLRSKAVQGGRRLLSRAWSLHRCPAQPWECVGLLSQLSCRVLPSPSQVSCSPPSDRLKLPSSLPVFLLTYDHGLAPFLLSPSFVLTLKDSLQRSKHMTTGGCVLVSDSSSSHPPAPQVTGRLSLGHRECGKGFLPCVTVSSRDSWSVCSVPSEWKGRLEMGQTQSQASGQAVAVTLDLQLHPDENPQWRLLSVALKEEPGME